MKVLEINSFFNAGGPPRIVKGVYDAVIAQGDECVLAAAREKPYEYMKIIRVGNNFSVKINALRSRLFDCDGFVATRATKKLIRQIKAFDPDVIHLHNLHGYYINVKVLFDYLKTANKKVVWTLHDCWAFTGHCAHFDYAGCDKWKSGGCRNCPQKKEYPKSVLLDNSKKNFKRKMQAFTGVKDLTLVTPSKWLENLVKQSFLKEYNAVTVYNGIDLDKFKPVKSDILKRYGVENKKILLGVANVWTQKKGFGDFLKLAKILPEEYKIVLIGLTEKQIKTLPDNVLGLARTESIEELCKWYTAADKFLNLTDEDTYPTVNLEAQACGTPVITYKTGGSVESVPGENVVPKGDINAVLGLLDKNLSVTGHINTVYDMLDGYLKIL